jgi:hypothetical protein
MAQINHLRSVSQIKYWPGEVQINYVQTASQISYIHRVAQINHLRTVSQNKYLRGEFRIDYSGVHSKSTVTSEFPRKQAIHVAPRTILRLIF